MGYRFSTTFQIACFLILVFILGIKLYDNYKIKKTHQLRTKETAVTKYTHYKPELAYQGVTIIPQRETSKVILVDMLGKIRKTWDLDLHRFRLLENFNFLTVSGIKKGRRDDRRKTIKEYNWEGE